MKPKFVSVGLLLVILLLNIIATQYMVHQYFYENYTNTIVAAVINIILFPTAFLIYKRGVNIND